MNEANTMRICEMAQLAAERIAHGQIRVRYETGRKERRGYAADTGLRLSADKLRALGWAPSKGLEEMYKDLIRWYGRNAP